MWQLAPARCGGGGRPVAAHVRLQVDLGVGREAGEVPGHASGAVARHAPPPAPLAAGAAGIERAPGAVRAVGEADQRLVPVGAGVPRLAPDVDAGPVPVLLLVEHEVNQKLQAIMQRAVREVLAVAEERDLSMRMAAYLQAVRLGRLGHARSRHIPIGGR